MNPFDTFQRVRIEEAIVYEGDGPISSVLVPVDLSASTVPLLQYARIFAKRFGAVVQFLHVVQLNIAGEERGAPRTRLIAGLADAARRELLKLIEMFWESDLVCAIAVREGRPDDIIVQEARKANAGMIIMGIRNRPWVSRMLRPDILGRVIRNSPCPVLAVQTPGTLKLSPSPAHRSKQPALTASFSRSFREARI